jgi:uncharacterized membrane protein
MQALAARCEELRARTGNPPLERQFYRDITNTRNAKIVCIVIVINYIIIFIVQSCQFPSILVSKPENL